MNAPATNPNATAKLLARIVCAMTAKTIIVAINESKIVKLTLTMNDIEFIDGKSKHASA